LEIGDWRLEIMNFENLAGKCVADFKEEFNFLPENLLNNLVSFLRFETKNYIYYVNFKKITNKRKEIPDNIWNQHIFPWFKIPSDIQCKILQSFEKSIQIIFNAPNNSEFIYAICNKLQQICEIPIEMFPMKFWKNLKYKLIKDIPKIQELKAFEGLNDLKTCATLLHKTKCRNNCNYCLKVTPDTNLKEIYINPEKKFMFLNSEDSKYCAYVCYAVLHVKTREIIKFEDRSNGNIRRFCWATKSYRELPLKWKGKIHKYFGNFMLKLHQCD
jgi:hypothetical protein